MFTIPIGLYSSKVSYLSDELIEALPNVVSWWDALDPSTITLSGSDITNVQDKSIVGNHLSQPTVSLRPIYQTSVAELNGKPGMFFGGPTDVNYLNMTVNPYAPGGKTTFIVGRAVSGATRIFASFSTGGGAGSWYFFTQTTNNRTNIDRSGTNVVLDGALYDELGIMALSTSDTDFKGFKNGITMPKITSTPRVFNVPANAGYLGITQPAGGSAALLGWICEVVAIQDYITDQTAIDISLALKQKWEIA